MRDMPPMLETLPRALGMADLSWPQIPQMRPRASSNTIRSRMQASPIPAYHLRQQQPAVSTRFPARGTRASRDTLFIPAWISAALQFVPRLLGVTRSLGTNWRAAEIQAIFIRAATSILRQRLLHKMANSRWVLVAHIHVRSTSRLAKKLNT